MTTTGQRLLGGVGLTVADTYNGDHGTAATVTRQYDWVARMGHLGHDITWMLNF